MSMYSKPFDELTETEKQLLAHAKTVIEMGHRLYGPDTSHISWVLSRLVYLLDKHSEEQPTVAAYVELVKDESGYGIAVLDLGQAHNKTSE